jgi:hypothetical protein
MKNIITILTLLCAAIGLRAANPAFEAFRGTNEVLIKSNVSAGRIIIGPAVPISTTASNAAIALNLWTNTGQRITQVPDKPVYANRDLRIGSNAFDIVFEYVNPTNGLMIGFQPTVGDPYSSVIGQIIRGPGAFTRAVDFTEVATNRIASLLELENDDAGFGWNLNSVIDSSGVTLKGASILGGFDFFRFGPANAQPYLMRSTAMGSGNLVQLQNSVTNVFVVDYAGNSTNLGRTSSTLGFASFSTIATNQIPATGWTNNELINVTVYTTATAVSFTINNRAGTVLYTSPTLTATIPVNLQPGWSVRAASGLTGTVLPF